MENRFKFRSSENFLPYRTFATSLVNDESVAPSSSWITEELRRLFVNLKVGDGTSSSSPVAPYEAVREEFARNGNDSEYCPDLTAHLNQTIVPKVHVPLKSFKIGRAKKKMVGDGTHCVFCKNNGEDARFYRSHVLKDHHGKVACPILRAYTCPICKANGDNAHTKKYCPQKQADDCQWMSMIKTLRTSTGKRKCHVENVVPRPVPRPLFKTNK